MRWRCSSRAPQALGIRKISDLLQPRTAALRLGLSHEFLQRADGWPALKAAYALPIEAGAGLDHGLAYDAIAAGKVDVIDVYSTDAKVGRYHLRVLEDDRALLPALRSGPADARRARPGAAAAASKAASMRRR